MNWLELAKALVAPVVGLLGVYMGVRLAAGREDKRLDRQERSAREARLLDHKRAAHADLLAAIAAYEVAHDDFHHKRTADKPSDGDVFAAFNSVLMFGSAEAAEKGRSLCFLIPRPDEEVPAADRRLKIRDARYDYLKAIRADVGIEGDHLMRST